MIVHRVKQSWFPGEMSVNTYIVEFDDYCILIDASASMDEVRKTCDKPIKAVLITHGHYDHILNIVDYDNLNIPIYANEKIGELLTDSNKNVSDLFNQPTTYKIKNLNTIYGDSEIQIGSVNIKAYHTPGHSIDSSVYLIEDTLFTGDTAFSVAVGRVDLPTGDLSELISSLDKVKGIDFKDMHPGHGRISNKDEQMINISKWQNKLKEIELERRNYVKDYRN